MLTLQFLRCVALKHSYRLASVAADKMRVLSQVTCLALLALAWIVSS